MKDAQFFKIPVPFNKLSYELQLKLKEVI